MANCRATAENQPLALGQIWKATPTYLSLCWPVRIRQHLENSAVYARFRNAKSFEALAHRPLRAWVQEWEKLVRREVADDTLSDRVQPIDGRKQLILRVRHTRCAKTSECLLIGCVSLAFAAVTVLGLHTLGQTTQPPTFKQMRRRKCNYSTQIFERVACYSCYRFRFIIILRQCLQKS
jgi:hypothetical protein